MVNATSVLKFWFEESAPEDWWAKSPEFDRRVTERFAATYAQAAACELWTWRASAEGRLAEILVLDQFARNMFRDDARAFAADPLALALAQEAVQAGADRKLPTQRRTFLYLPYMHSESLAIHAVALQLFAQPGMEYNLDFEKRHKAILERFGRYPHRNAILGRESTPAELEFLKGPGSAF